MVLSLVPPLALPPQTGKKSYEARLTGAGIGAMNGGGVGYYMETKEAKPRQQLENTGKG